jgi:glycosyltransferase involved in cell wall biosynthesis
MSNGRVLCSISTRGRYETTLPLAIQSVLMQTRLPDKLIIFDDNDHPRDVREIQVYQYLFMMMELKGLPWEWKFADRKGQHYNHDKANKMGFEWVWRMDDDTVAEPDVLEKLMALTGPDVGAVGGSILTPPFQQGLVATGKIEDIYTEPNLQWDYIKETKEVDHLHCSFLYRAGVVDYNLNLSRIAHREETLFTYGLKRKGYKVLITPTVTWHLKNRFGGIRDGVREMFEHDEAIFAAFLKEGKIDKPIVPVVVLDCGMGDHVVFSHVLKDMQPALVFSCYPDIVPGRSIAEARELLGDKYDSYNIYRKMDEWNWKGSLEDAFRKLYGVPKK